MAEMTNAQTALMAAVTAKRPDQYETDSTTVARAETYLKFLNSNS